MAGGYPCCCGGGCVCAGLGTTADVTWVDIDPTAANAAACLVPLAETIPGATITGSVEACSFSDDLFADPPTTVILAGQPGGFSCIAGSAAGSSVGLLIYDDGGTTKIQVIFNIASSGSAYESCTYGQVAFSSCDASIPFTMTLNKVSVSRTGSFDSYTWPATIDLSFY
jgi:hypothetical protein